MLSGMKSSIYLKCNRFDMIITAEGSHMIVNADILSDFVLSDMTTAFIGDNQFTREREGVDLDEDVGQLKKIGAEELAYYLSGKLYVVDQKKFDERIKVFYKLE